MTSSQQLLNFTVDQLKTRNVSILSVFKDKLLISRFGQTQLYIYSSEGLYKSTIKTNDNDELYDATWTPRRNIVYTSWHKKVVVISKAGKVINKYTQMADPRCLSVSNDGIIYVADYKTGVYQSIDEGVSWSLVFKSTDGSLCEQVIKVTTDRSDDFWTLETKNNSCHLRVYSMDKRHADSNVKWRNIDVSTTDGKPVDLSACKLSHDGNTNIFLCDCKNKAVHVLSVTGQYQCQLLSSHHIKNEPSRLVVDSQQLLYLGQEKGIVEVFKLM